MNRYAIILQQRRAWWNTGEYEQYFSLFGFTLNPPLLKLLDGPLSISLISDDNGEQIILKQWMSA